MGYANNVKIYQLPNECLVENSLKFMYNDAFIHDIFAMSKEFKKVHMELYVEQVVDVPEVIEGPRLLMGKVTISFDEEMGEVSGEHVEEVEEKSGGDICDLRVGKDINREHSNLVTMDINIDVSKAVDIKGSGNMSISRKYNYDWRGY